MYSLFVAGFGTMLLILISANSFYTTRLNSFISDGAQAARALEKRQARAEYECAHYQGVQAQCPDGPVVVSLVNSAYGTFGTISDHGRIISYWLPSKGNMADFSALGSFYDSLSISGKTVLARYDAASSTVRTFGAPQIKIANGGISPPSLTLPVTVSGIPDRAIVLLSRLS